MKKITIGRGRECDVRLEDSTDLVSRRQAVIKVSPSGKMEIFDLSSNGTYVNGEKVEKPNGMPVKRGDVVNFAHVADLDWAQVKDPYRRVKITILTVLAAVAILCVLYFSFADALFNAKENTSDVHKEVTTVQEDTIVPPGRSGVAPAFDKSPAPNVGQNSRTGGKRTADDASMETNAPAVKEALQEHKSEPAEELDNTAVLDAMRNK